MTTNPWDQAEHALIVLDYSKLLVGVAVHGAGYLSVNWVKGHLDAEAKLKRMITNWRYILDTLTEEEKAAIEQQKPGAIQDLEATLQRLQNRLRHLSAQLESTAYWERVWPWSDISRDIGDVLKIFDKANRDFTATTRIGLVANPVEAVVEAVNAIPSEVNEVVEMTPVSGHGNAATPPDQTGSMGAEANTTASSDPAPPGPAGSPTAPRQDVSSTYEWAVATTAALLPAVLRGKRRGRPHVWPV
ncbi:hypothetical protein BV20DRAFT_1053165 [Pilatotrama ljubarskyi]|nr:hypothetical protein BV20DRAFT_1053165 [Pilatotrama ljubarskyi]